MHQIQSIALLLPEIKELLASKQYELLKQVILECSPLDFLDSWRHFDDTEKLQLFKLLPQKSSLKLFEVLSMVEQKKILQLLTDSTHASAEERGHFAPILEEMASPDLARLFHNLSPRTLRQMSTLIKRQEALAHVDYLMQFPQKSAGSLMHPEFIKLGPQMTARQALQVLQAVTRPHQREHLNCLYVTDSLGKLRGALSLHDIVSAASDQELAELMTPADKIKIRPEVDQEDVAKLFSKYNLNSAPVVGDDGQLIGTIVLSDVINIIHQEATEDIAKMVGTRASDLETKSVLKIFGLRMPWLLVTLGGGAVISTIINLFEPVLSQVLALAFFSPLIAGMGGNVGSQSAVIIVRRIALGNWSRSGKFRTIFREMGVGTLLGLFYGALVGCFAYVFYSGQYGPYFSVAVAVAMCCAMTVAATMGACGPILFDHFDIDPATGTGPLVSTVTDIISNLIYFGLAYLLLFGAGRAAHS